MNTLRECLEYLLQHCDGVDKKDDEGLNKVDSGFARSVVKSPVWSVSQSATVFRMLQKYRGQLEAGGMVLQKTYSDTPTSPTPASKSVIIDYYGDLGIFISFDYSPVILQLVKSVNPSGTYIPRRKKWMFMESSTDDILKKFPTAEYTPEFKKYIDDRDRQNIEKTAISKIISTWCDKWFDQTSLNIKPFQHQIDTVYKFMTTPDHRILVADEQGTGKTMSALLCARAIREYYDRDIRIIVLCPVSLKRNWVKEAGVVGVPVEVYSSQSPPLPLENHDYITIADECHKFQLIRSQCSKKYLELTDGNRCIGVIAMSGTPMKNGKPSNLYPVLKSIRHPVTDSRKDYERRYCNAHTTPFCAWDISGANNLEELNIKIRDQMLRRTKEMCLDLPEKLYVDVWCEDHKESEDAYKLDFTAAKKDYKDRVKKGLIKNDGEAIVMLGLFRRLASQYKVHQTILLAEEILEAGGSVVIFTDFLISAKKIAEHYGVSPFTGETKQEEKKDGVTIYPRQKMVDDFQSGINRVFVGTIKAGGVGITLTRASNLIMVDRPWTTGDYDQSTDRIHRIGAVNRCTIYNIMGKPIDEKMVEIHRIKRDNIETVLDVSAILTSITR
jgi:SNF2 family DNA or RNA helicase